MVLSTFCCLVFVHIIQHFCRTQFITCLLLHQCNSLGPFIELLWSIWYSQGNCIKSPDLTSIFHDVSEIVIVTWLNVPTWFPSLPFTCWVHSMRYSFSHNHVCQIFCLDVCRQCFSIYMRYMRYILAGSSVVLLSKLCTVLRKSTVTWESVHTMKTFRKLVGETIYSALM